MGVSIVMKKNVIYEGTKEEIIKEFESKLFDSEWAELFPDYDEYPDAKVEIRKLSILEQIEQMYENITRNNKLRVGKVFYKQHIPIKNQTNSCEYEIVGEWIAFTDIPQKEIK